jgi:hypothetical protein
MQIEDPHGVEDWPAGSARAVKEELCEERAILGGGESLIAEPQSAQEHGRNPLIDPETSRSGDYSGACMDFFGNGAFSALLAVTFWHGIPDSIGAAIVAGILANRSQPWSSRATVRQGQRP